MNYVRGKIRRVKEFLSIEIILNELILRNATSTFLATTKIRVFGKYKTDES